MDPQTDSTTTPELPRLLNITQLADTLGVNVRHVRRLVHERRIPFIKWGHLIRFDPSDIARWIAENRHDHPFVRPGYRPGHPPVVGRR